MKFKMQDLLRPLSRKEFDSLEAITEKQIKATLDKGREDMAIYLRYQPAIRLSNRRYK